MLQFLFSYADVDVKDVGVKIYGMVAGVPVPFPFDQPDACKDPNSGIHCPVTKGTELVYRATLPIKSYPTVSTSTSLCSRQHGI